ncbi:hypothetical protein GC209_17935 [bacterium]|nr:hypothetical protein [bacterium]
MARLAPEGDMAEGGPSGPSALLVALDEAVGLSQRAPLSARHALQAVAMIDRLSDQVYARRSGLPVPDLAHAQDILSFRAALRDGDPAVAALMDLMTCGAASPRLQVVAAQLGPDDFARLPVGDLMVSLYNSGTVPRLMLVQPDGTMLAFQDLLRAAAAWWEATLKA